MDKEIVSPEFDWKPKGVCEWLSDEVKPLSGADNSIIEAASEIQRLISRHVPLDSALNWMDFEASLPNKDAARPKVGEESSHPSRRAIVPVSRENVAHDEGVRHLRSGNGEIGESIKKALETHDDYNEDSIQIFRVDLDPRFDWRLAEEWASKYRRDAKFILRGIMACRECGVSPTWFLNRYLERNQNAPRREDVEEAHRRLLAEAQGNRK